MEDRNQGLTNRLERLDDSSPADYCRPRRVGATGNGSDQGYLSRCHSGEALSRWSTPRAMCSWILGKFGSKNHPDLVIYDSKGVLRASIGIDGESDNSGDAAFDHKGVLRAFSGAVETESLKGLSGHFTYDQTGAERIAINVDPVDDFIGLANLDASGTPRVVAGTPLGARDEFLEMHDANGTLRVGLASDYDSTGGEGLNLFDKGAFFREALSIDDGNFGGTGNEFLGFANDVGFPGYFSAAPGEGGAYVTNNSDGSARTGALPANAP